jgi:CRP-like cAMP-binding protein
VVWGYRRVVHNEFKESLRDVTQAWRRKLSVFFDVNEEIEQALRVLCQDKARFGRNDTIINEGDTYEYVYLIDTGWAIRQKVLSSGSRQIVNFALPGDFLCFNATLFETSDYHLTAKTEVEAFVIKKSSMGALLSSHPALGLALSWTNAHEESLLAERIVSLGRRSAAQRMAHLFCELWRRLQLLDLTGNDSFPLPMTQEDLADTLGLSIVHVSRTLRQLRAAGYIEADGHEIRILDMRGLEHLAGFDDGYLHFTEVKSTGYFYR